MMRSPMKTLMSSKRFSQIKEHLSIAKTLAAQAHENLTRADHEDQNQPEDYIGYGTIPRLGFVWSETGGEKRVRFSKEA